MVRDLRNAVSNQPDRLEPLALLWARYASEDNDNVVVAVAVQPFAADAYVRGPNGANFDVNWLMAAMNVAGEANAGTIICHQHAHAGKPAFSSVDNKTNEQIMAKQPIVSPWLPYGAMVLSNDDFHAVMACRNGLQEFDVRVVLGYSPNLRVRRRRSD